MGFGDLKSIASAASHGLPKAPQSLWDPLLNSKRRTEKGKGNYHNTEDYVRTAMRFPAFTSKPEFGAFFWGGLDTPQNVGP